MTEEMRLELLGRLKIAHNGQPVSGFVSSKAQALLCYLAVTGRSHARPAVASLLWGELPETTANANLRVVLFNLRQLLDPFLIVTRHTVALNPASCISLDVAEFEARVRLQESAPPATAIQALREAVNLYRGELLEGFTVRDAPDFEEWSLAQRERLRALGLHALHTLAVHHTARGAYAAGIDYTTRLLAIEPWREEAHRQLMWLLALSGQRSAALAHFESCRALLAAELGVEPLPETITLYEQIRDGQIGQPTLPATLLLDPLTLPPDGDAAPLPFVGRAAEWAALKRCWQATQAGAPHVALLQGEPGVGKTRLAEAFRDWTASQGALVASARLHGAEGELPYAPAIAWLRSPTLQPELGTLAPRWRSELARILPELGSPPVTTPSGSWQRQRLFEAMARALLGRGRPTLLLLDDLHVAGRETLEWLHYVLRFDRRAPLMLVATLRPEDARVPEALTAFHQALHTSASACEITLGPLDAAETDELATHLAAGRDPAEMARFCAVSEGNPFILITLAQEGAATPEIDALPAPVRAMLARRLAPLSPAARELLGAAAVVGRLFDFEAAAAASNQAQSTALAALDELQAHRLVAETAEGCYRFTHGLLHRLVDADLGAGRRKWLRRRIGTSGNAMHSQLPTEGHAPRHRATTRYRQSFELLMQGHLDEAEAQAQAALQAAESLGVLSLQAQALALLALIYRRRGQVEATRMTVARTLDVASANAMVPEMALAHAQRAWVAWHEARYAEAEAQSTMTLQLWEQATTPPSFQWAALWPLIGVLLLQERHAEAVAAARALLAPHQQPLPEPLAAHIRAALADWDPAHPAATHLHLAYAVELAQTFGYL